MYHVVAVVVLGELERVCIVYTRGYSFDEGRVLGFDPVLVHETGGIQ